MDNLTRAIREYALDTENAEKNYTVATIYESIDQTAAAISFYLRTAELTKDDLLAYECMLKIGLCFERQGKRGNSVRGAYKHALCILPRRPEAYFLLARYYERIGDHVSGYLFAEQGLKFAVLDCNPLMKYSDINCKPLRYWVEYPGSYGLLFQKAVSSWWWGKPDECRALFLELWNKYPQLDANHKKAVENNLNQLKIPFNIKIDTVPRSLTESATEIVENNDNTMDIVLQGPYTEDTAEVINTYLNLPFVKNIILSCWEGDVVVSSKISNTNRVFICYNKKPSSPGTDNRNMQIVSSREGLKSVTTKYAAKMRTDQCYDVQSMNNMYDFFMRGDKEKIYVAGMYPNLQFHPRDHIFWGSTEKLRTLFDCPLEINGLGDRIKLTKDQLWKYTPYFTRAETYLGAHYIGRFDERVNTFLIYPERYLWDNAPLWAEAHKLSDELTPKFFTPFPREGVNLKWKRKGWNAYPYDDQYASGERWGIHNQTDEIDFGDNDEVFKSFAYDEIIIKRLYEKFNTVKDGDVVVDIGANIGLFPISLGDRKPQRVICVEPSNSLLEPLRKNTSKLPFPVKICNYGISALSGDKVITKTDWIYGNHGATTFKTETFKRFLKENDLDKIDFLKVDCEGGEYDIFTEKNRKFLTEKVGYIAGEWHLGGLEDGIGKFIKFRNLYLNGKTNWQVYEPYIWKQVDPNDLMKDEWIHGYYEYWNPKGEAAQFMIYIDNRV
jgi:FkbM family methyltransferase